MGIEIAARANSGTSLDILPSFIIDHSTIGDLRKALARPETSTPQPNTTSGFSMLESPPESTVGSSTGFVDSTPAAHDRTLKKHTSASDVEEDTVLVSPPVEDSCPAPSARVALLEGRPSSGKRPFFLIADSTGSIATYIHLPPFRSRIPVYDIDLPYLRCPIRLTTEVGIPGAAKFIADVVVKFQPDGSFAIGEFSGGAMLAYEVCSQLSAAGSRVDSLLLIDMCCPRPAGLSDKAKVGWKAYESIAAQGGLRNASNATQQHLCAIFASVAAYCPLPMTAQERPGRTAIVWAKTGLTERCSGDLEWIRLLVRSDIPIAPFAGFMEDPRMGTIA